MDPKCNRLTHNYKILYIITDFGKNQCTFRNLCSLTNDRLHPDHHATTHPEREAADATLPPVSLTHS